MQRPHKSPTAMCEHRDYRVDVTDVTDPDNPHPFAPLHFTARSVASALRQASMLTPAAWAPTGEDDTA